jgi:hypothetical protein
LLEARPEKFATFPSQLQGEFVLSQRSVCLFLTVLLLVASAAMSQDFSAEMVHFKPANSTAVTNVNASGDRIRFEIAGVKQGTIVLLDLATQTSTMILPQNQTYIVSAPGKSRAALPLFKITDPDNACPNWEKAFNKPGSCSKVGEETLNRRSTVKYHGTSQSGETGDAWVDRKLHLVIKWDGEKTGVELQKIQEGPQSAALFKIPADYQKFDVEAAKQQQKKSRPATKTH